MSNIFQIYLYICATIISMAIIVGLIAIALNIIVYCYQTIVGFNVFIKFLKKYNREMQVAKKRNCKECINRKTNQCPNSSKCYDTFEKPYFQERGVLDVK